MEIPEQKWMISGHPYFRKPPHINIRYRIALYTHQKKEVGFSNIKIVIHSLPIGWVSNACLVHSFSHFPTLPKAVAGVSTESHSLQASRLSTWVTSPRNQNDVASKSHRLWDTWGIYLGRWRVSASTFSTYHLRSVSCIWSILYTMKQILNRTATGHCLHDEWDQNFSSNLPEKREGDLVMQLRGDWNLSFHRLLQKISLETTMAGLGLLGSRPSPSVPRQSTPSLSSLKPGPWRRFRGPPPTEIHDYIELLMLVHFLN